LYPGFALVKKTFSAKAHNNNNNSLTENNSTMREAQKEDKPYGAYFCTIRRILLRFSGLRGRKTSIET
jgi:hypothetical protein